MTTSPIRIHSDFWEFGLGEFAFGVSLHQYVEQQYSYEFVEQAKLVDAGARRRLMSYVRDQVDDVVALIWINTTLIVGTLDESYFAVAKLENDLLYRCSKGVYVRVNS